MDQDDLTLAILLFFLPLVTVCAGVMIRWARGDRPDARRLGTLGFVAQVVSILGAAGIVALVFVIDGSVWSEPFAILVTSAAATWGGGHLIALGLHAAAWRAGGRAPS